MYLLPLRPHHPVPHLTIRCQMENGDQQLLVITFQMLEVIKEALPTMAGRAWKMTPWAWEVEGEEAEAMVWGVSLEAGVALEEVREVERALEADPVQTETAASQKGVTAEKATLILHQYRQLFPGPIWTQGFCPTLGGDRHPYGRTLPGMLLLLLTISSRVLEEMKESIAAEAPAGAQHHRQLPLRPQEVGGVGPAAQAQVQEVPAGEIDHPLDGTAKSQRVEEGRVAGTMDSATRGATATTPVTPGAITLTKMTGPIHGQHQNLLQPPCIAVMEVKAGVMVEKVLDLVPATTGGSLRKVQARWAGTATATVLALDVGASQVEPTPAAATLG